MAIATTARPAPRPIGASKPVTPYRGAPPPPISEQYQRVLMFAREAAWRGWPVFPLKPGTKEPAITDWTPTPPARVKVADRAGWTTKSTTDDTVIRAWSRRTTAYGVATGPETGLLVIEDDPRHDGDLEQVARELGITLPPTPVVRSGGGGHHYYFQYPDGVAINISAGKIAPGIDVRAFHGLVVGAGSEVNGRRYQWEVHPDEAPLAPLPEALLRRLIEPEKPRRAVVVATPVLPPADPGTLPEAAVLCLRLALRREPGEGQRNAAAYNLACQLRNEGVAQADAEHAMAYFVAALTGGAAQPGQSPFTLGEAMATLHSAYQGAAQPANLLHLPSPAEIVTNPQCIGECCGLVTFLASLSPADRELFAAALRADMLPRGQRGRQQQFAVQDAFVTLFPGAPISDSVWKQIAAGMRAAGYGPALAAVLVYAALWVRRNPHALTAARNFPIAYYIEVLRTAGIKIAGFKRSPRPAAVTSMTTTPDLQAAPTPTTPDARDRGDTLHARVEHMLAIPAIDEVKRTQKGQEAYQVMSELWQAHTLAPADAQAHTFILADIGQVADAIETFHLWQVIPGCEGADDLYRRLDLDLAVVHKALSFERLVVPVAETVHLDPLELVRDATPAQVDALIEFARKLVTQQERFVDLDGELTRRGRDAREALVHIARTPSDVLKAEQRAAREAQKAQKRLLAEQKRQAKERQAQQAQRRPEPPPMGSPRASAAAAAISSAQPAAIAVAPPVRPAAPPKPPLDAASCAICGAPSTIKLSDRYGLCAAHRDAWRWERPDVKKEGCPVCGHRAWAPAQHGGFVCWHCLPDFKPSA